MIRHLKLGQKLLEKQGVISKSYQFSTKFVTETSPNNSSNSCTYEYNLDVTIKSRKQAKSQKLNNLSKFTEVIKATSKSLRFHSHFRAGPKTDKIIISIASDIQHRPDAKEMKIWNRPNPMLLIASSTVNIFFQFQEHVDKTNSLYT